MQKEETDNKDTRKKEEFKRRKGVGEVEEGKGKGKEAGKEERKETEKAGREAAKIWITEEVKMRHGHPTAGIHSTDEPIDRRPG